MKKLQPLVGTRQPSESDRAVQSCNDWLRLGPGRSLPKLLESYKNLAKLNGTQPTVSIGTLEQWSSTFQWGYRAEHYDADYDARKDVQRRAVMEEGIALDYERVRELKELYGLLKGQLVERGSASQALHNLWTKDYKFVGGETLEMERYNSQLVNDMLRILNDVAAETGGRSGRDPLEAVLKVVDYDQLTDEQVNAIADGADILQVLLTGKGLGPLHGPAGPPST